MASFQAFGYRGKSGTCLWCGRKLRFEQVLDDTPGAKGRTAYDVPTQRAETPGAYQNGFFDTQGCGFQFGVANAKDGRRYKLTEG
jgi:hypothetical protein